MKMAATVHLDPNDGIEGDTASSGTLRNYGVLRIDRERGYGNITVFLGDNPTETRASIRKMRKALSDIVRALPRDESPES